MKILLKQATILDDTSAYHQKKKDILVDQGKIIQIDDAISLANVRTIESPDLHVSQSWVDLKADFCDPGHEFQEDLQSGLAVAADGGFGHVFLVPTTYPVTDTKAQVNYLISGSKNNVVTIHPMGAITKNTDGKELAEMYDMFVSGARLFTDNTKYIPAGVFMHALLYVKNFGGTIVSFPQNESITHHGQVNEGIASLKTGLGAIPSIGEQIEIQRDLSLLEYTEGNLHFSGVSTEAGVQLIREAKSKGLKVTCDVYVHNLMFNELNVIDFGTNHKVFPPYRKESDRKSLWNGIKDGTIDCIVSNHQPRAVEYKDIEFDNAEFGATTLQTFYAVLNKISNNNPLDFIQQITTNPRKIVPLEKDVTIKEGNEVDLTLFDPKIEWSFNEDTNLSKSKNSPFFGQKMIGRAIGIIKNDSLYIRD